MSHIPPRIDVPGISYDVAVTKNLIVNRTVHEAAHAFMWCAYLALDNRIQEDTDLRFEWGPKPKARMVGIVRAFSRVPVLGRGALGAIRQDLVMITVLNCEAARRAQQVIRMNSHAREADYGIRLAIARNEGIRLSSGYSDCYEVLFLTALLQLAGDVNDIRLEKQDTWVLDNQTITPLAIRAYAATQTTTVMNTEDAEVHNAGG